MASLGERLPPADGMQVVTVNQRAVHIEEDGGRCAAHKRLLPRTTSPNLPVLWMRNSPNSLESARLSDSRSVRLERLPSWKGLQQCKDRLDETAGNDVVAATAVHTRIQRGRTRADRCRNEPHDGTRPVPGRPAYRGRPRTPRGDRQGSGRIYPSLGGQRRNSARCRYVARGSRVLAA